MKSNKNEVGKNQVWPDLPAPDEWQETLNTVHLWSQIVGKIRLENMPWINHSWHVPLYVSARGLTTSLIPHKTGGFEIEFNFEAHKLEIQKMNGNNLSFDLKSLSVAEFYEKIIDNLKQMGVETNIFPKPVELPDPILPFYKNSAKVSYDADALYLFWQALTNVHRVFTQFRSGFTGKVSPVHFFWGAFDLAVTRFSGRTAPKHPGGIPNCPDWVMVESYSHELSSAGFWPGSGFGEAAFYSYSYPEPEGFQNSKIKPESAMYHQELGEYILPYKAVKDASDPDELLLSFLQSTYEAAAENGGWNRNELERKKNIKSG